MPPLQPPAPPDRSCAAALPLRLASGGSSANAVVAAAAPSAGARECSGSQPSVTAARTSAAAGHGPLGAMPELTSPEAPPLLRKLMPVAAGTLDPSAAPDSPPLPGSGTAPTAASLQSSGAAVAGAHAAPKPGEDSPSQQASELFAALASAAEFACLADAELSQQP